MNNSEQNSTNYHPIQDFYRHQQEVLKTHQQYLAQQMEYARAFWQVLQQFSHDSDGKLIDLPSGIQQNLQWFHHHQQETLKIHEQYLQGQSEQTQIALQWGINADGVVPALPRVSSSSTVSETKPAPPNLLPKFEPSAPNYNPAPTPALQQPVTVPNPTQTIPTPQSLAPVSPLPPAQNQIPPYPETPSPLSIDKVLLEIVADKTGYPTDMLETDMDLEADLGIDSIKRVEILGALQEKLPDLQVQADELAEQRTLGQILGVLEPERNHQNRTSSNNDSAYRSEESATNLQDTLLHIVEEKTGYPKDMLELNMDLEADLGIDSIKRVEILGALQEKLSDLQVQPDELAERRTLGEILETFSSDSPKKNS